MKLFKDHTPKIAALILSVSVLAGVGLSIAPHDPSVITVKDDQSTPASLIDTEHVISSTSPSEQDAEEVVRSDFYRSEDTEQSGPETTDPQAQESSSDTEDVAQEDATQQKNASPFTDGIDGEQLVSDLGSFPLRNYETSLVPNDPGYDQWWVQSQDLESAWGVGSGSTQTSIAIIDTGFDLGHEEFTGRWLENSGEQGTTTSENPSDLNCTDQSITVDMSCNNIDDDFDGILDNETGTTTTENPSRLNCTDQSITLDKSCNLIDDDANGYVDDVLGWDFAHFDQNVEAGEVDPTASGNYHGTQVAGAAAATGNNGVGVAGVDWSAKILPLQVFDDYENATSLTVSRAVIYAADQDVDVINLSLGSTFPDTYLRYAIQYALDSGSAVVAASGNDGCECINYPANYPEVIAVGATEWNDNRVYFSNWGDNLDIVAPGVGMSLPNWSAGGDSAYTNYSSGTSFSAPFVSGLLSLAKSHHPDASWDELLSAIADTGIRSSTAHDSELGFAITDSAAFLNRLVTPRAQGDVYALRSDETKLYFCDEGELGTHTVYRLIAGSDRIYAVNSYELFVYEQFGWNVHSKWRVCTVLPDDTFDSVRIIDLLREFENITD